MHGKGGTAAVAHGAGDGGGSGGHVTGGEDTGPGGTLAFIHLDPVAGGQLQTAGVFTQESQIGLHAHGEDYGVAFQDMLATGHGFQGQLALFVKVAVLDFEVVHAGDLVAFGTDGGHGAGIVHMHAFLGGQFQVFGRSAHLTGLFQADHMDVLGTQATGSEGAVEGHAAAAHDDDVLADLAGVLAQRGGTQEFNGLDGLFGAGDGQAVFSGYTGGHDNGIVAGGDLFHGDVHTHAGVDAGTHAGFQHQAHFAVHHIAGQTEVRHAVAGHAAQQGLGFVDGDFMAQQGQEVGGRQAGRAAADDGSFLAGGGTTLEEDVAAFGKGLGSAFQGADVQAAVHFLTVAGIHAEVGADAAGDAREGVLGT